MHLDNVPIGSIKSISQQALARCWSRHAGSFPSIFEFAPDDRVHDARQLVIWTVERGEGGVSFRALHQGKNVAQVFGSSWAGKTMAEAVPAGLRRHALEAAVECATSGCCIYAIYATRDATGERVSCERLILPLGRAGRVEQIVSSLQLISLHGDFERQTVLRRFEASAEIVTLGKITLPSR